MFALIWEHTVFKCTFLDQFQKQPREAILEGKSKRNNFDRRSMEYVYLNLWYVN